MDFGAGAVFSAINTCFKFSEFAIKLSEVGHENAIFVRNIQRVKYDLEEAERLFYDPAIHAKLKQHPQRLQYIKRVIHDTKTELNEIGLYVERVRSEDQRDGAISFSTRVRWVLSDHEKLENRRQGLHACQTSLSNALGILHPMETLDTSSVAGSSSIPNEPPPAYTFAGPGDFLSPHARRMERKKSARLAETITKQSTVNDTTYTASNAGQRSPSAGNTGPSDHKIDHFKDGGSNYPPEKTGWVNVDVFSNVPPQSPVWAFPTTVHTPTKEPPIPTATELGTPQTMFFPPASLQNEDLAKSSERKANSRLSAVNNLGPVNPWELHEMPTGIERHEMPAEPITMSPAPYGSGHGYGTAPQPLANSMQRLSLSEPAGVYSESGQRKIPSSIGRAPGYAFELAGCTPSTSSASPQTIHTMGATGPTSNAQSTVYSSYKSDSSINNSMRRSSANQTSQQGWVDSSNMPYGPTPSIHRAHTLPNPVSTYSNIEHQRPQAVQSQSAYPSIPSYGAPQLSATTPAPFYPSQNAGYQANTGSQSNHEACNITPEAAARRKRRAMMDAALGL